MGDIASDAGESVVKRRLSLRGEDSENPFKRIRTDVDHNMSEDEADPEVREGSSEVRVMGD